MGLAFRGRMDPFVASAADVDCQFFLKRGHQQGEAATDKKEAGTSPWDFPFPFVLTNLLPPTLSCAANIEPFFFVLIKKIPDGGDLLKKEKQ